MAELAPGQEELRRYREAGFTADEMGAWVQTKRHELSAAGFSEAEIDQDYFGNRLFNPAPLMQYGQANADAASKPVTTFKEAWEAGWGMGTASLGAAATTGGALPAQQITSDLPWHLRLTGNVATLVNDMPAMGAGYVLGGGQITGFAGSLALPAGLRHLFIDAIERGEVKSKEEFVDLALTTMWETTKGWVTGAATGGAGRGVGALLPNAAAPLVRLGAPAVAELTTMVTVGKALEGELPGPQDFVDGALILFGLKAAHVGASRLRDIWKKTGVTPQQILDDAKVDPTVWQETIDITKEIPSKYLALADNGTGVALKTAPKARIEPTLDPEAEQRAIAYFERPFSEVPRAPDEPARPPYQNLNYTDTPEAVKQSIDKLSEVYEAQITAARRGVVTNKESYEEAKVVFAELLGMSPKSVKLPGETQALESGDFTKLTANLYARKEVATRFAEELLRNREALVAKGKDVTAADHADFLAAIESTGVVLAEFAGAKAEVGRAMQMLQSTKKLDSAKQLEALKNIMEQYGGEANLTKMVEALGELKDPAQVLKYAKDATKATKWEMLVEAYRAALISGITTAQVNTLSTSLFTLARVPVRSVAAVHGTLHGGERVTFGESLGAVVGLLAGIRDASVVTAVTAKHGLSTAKDKGPVAGGKEVLLAMEKASENLSGRVSGEGRMNAIPGTVGHVVRAPFLALSLPDLFLKTVNQRSELYALAYRDAALNTKFRVGTSEFNRYVAERVSNPTPEMREASQKAGMRNTFNAPPGEISMALGLFIKKAHLEPIIPFRRTVGNLFKEGARMTPGLNLAVGEWRKDFAAGGARRDMALAEITVGGALMAAIYVAAQDGTITGGESPDQGQRVADRAAGKRPYSVKIGNEYVFGYQRMAPYGMLIGMAADAQQVKQYMTQDEHDKLATMIGTAIAKNVTNQTFMSGVTNVINAAGDPGRYGESYVEGVAGSFVPGLLSQMARERDPLEREIEGSLDAIRARIPGWREGLRPKIDVFGEPVKTPEKMWYGSPFGISTLSTDKVRTEAMRIGFAPALVPKKLDARIGVSTSSTQIELTPEQRDIFATEAGQIAHATLSRLVSAPGWDKTPQLLKRQMYERAFEISRRQAGIMALTPKERAVGMKTAIDNVINELREQ